LLSILKTPILSALPQLRVIRLLLRPIEMSESVTIVDDVPKLCLPAPGAIPPPKSSETIAQAEKGRIENMSKARKVAIAALLILSNLMPVWRLIFDFNGISG